MPAAIPADTMQAWRNVAVGVSVSWKLSKPLWKA